MSTETEKFLAWHVREQAKGLVDIKFFPGNITKSTQEDFFREANLANELHDAGTTVQRKDVF